MSNHQSALGFCVKYVCLSNLTYHNLLTFALAFLSIGLTEACAHGENWPGWRGPTQNGICNESKIPLSWGVDKNIHWKIQIPGVGHSSPIVWGNHIYVTTAIAETLSRNVICVDRESGTITWNVVVGAAPFETMHRDNSPASATPATDGQAVFVAFCLDGQLVVASIDRQGKLLWKVAVGSFASEHGFNTGLVLCGDQLIISGLQDGEEAFLASLNKSNGNVSWKVPRGVNVRSFSTPYLCNIDNKEAIILSGANQTAAYDRNSGTALWTMDGPASKTVSSIVVSDKLDLAYVCGGRDNQLFALKLNNTSSTGDESQNGRRLTAVEGSNDSSPDQRLAWSAVKSVPYITSPLLFGDVLHVMSDEGIYRAYDASTGKVLNERRSTGPVRASMVATEDRIYVTEQSGRTTVIANNAAWNVLAVNDLDEEILASPAISNGDYLLRSTSHLYLIRDKQL